MEQEGIFEVDGRVNCWVGEWEEHVFKKKHFLTSSGEQHGNPGFCAAAHRFGKRL